MLLASLKNTAVVHCVVYISIMAKMNRDRSVNRHNLHGLIRESTPIQFDGVDAFILHHGFKIPGVEFPETLRVARFFSIAWNARASTFLPW